MPENRLAVLANSTMLGYTCNAGPSPPGGWCCHLRHGHAGQHDNGDGKIWWGPDVVRDGRHLMNSPALPDDEVINREIMAIQPMWKCRIGPWMPKDRMEI